MALQSCPECGGKVSDVAAVCPHCGVSSYADGTPVEDEEGAVEAKKGSALFAGITLFFYLAYPIGLLLNLIGLFTGPRRGCFLVMFLLFVLIPAGGLIVAVVLTDAAVVDDILTKIKEAAERLGIPIGSG